MSIDFTTDLIGLPSFHISSWDRTSSNDWIAYLEPIRLNFSCPLCNQESLNHARPGRRLLRHRWIASYGTIFVSIPIYRQRCDSCNFTWSIEWEGIPFKGSATLAYRKMSIGMCKNRDLRSVSLQLGISYSTLERWYYHDVTHLLPDPKHHDPPKVVCLDEFALRKGHKYGLNLMDSYTGHVWQITEGRSREKVKQALQSWPFMQTPEVVVTDLAPGMADTVKSVWKGATIVADKFHVIQLFSDSLEARRKLMKSTNTHRKGRHQQRLLHKDPNQLKPEERVELKQWLNADSDLERLYQSLQDIRSVYDKPTIEEGKQALQNWIETHLYSRTSAVRSIAKTVVQWRHEIESYFRYRVTNAQIEGTHNKIKVLKRRGYGYRNMYRFITRIRLECKTV